MLDKLLANTAQIGGCMEWNGCYNTDGYPRINWHGNTNGKVHRIVYQLFTGKNITGKVIRHICDNPKCINPKHLIEGSALDNIKDRVKRERTHNQVSFEEKDKILRLRYGHHLTYKQIADQLGIKYKRVEYIIKRHDTSLM